MKPRPERNLRYRRGAMGPGWYIDFTFKGKRIRAFGGYDKAAAKLELARLRTEKDEERRGIRKPIKDILFEDHAKEFLELYCKQNKRSWARDKTSLDHLKKFFKARYLSEITAELIDKYKAKRKADLVLPARKRKKSKKQQEPRLVSPSTINRELACLKTCMNKAVKWGKLDRNPAAEIEKFREPNAKERILTIGEANQLLNKAGEVLRPVLIVALNTGMRKGEILGLRWQDVDFVKGFIHISDSKSGKSRDIPMNSLAFDTLYAMDRQREFVFENPETRTRVKDVRAEFKRACRGAEIKGVRFHDLRHTAATRMIEAGVDLVTVSRILGHSSIQMTMRYAHPTPENMRHAVQKLGEFFAPSRQKTDTAPAPKPVKDVKNYL